MIILLTLTSYLTFRLLCSKESKKKTLFIVSDQGTKRPQNLFGHRLKKDDNQKSKMFYFFISQSIQMEYVTRFNKNCPKVSEIINYKDVFSVFRKKQNYTCYEFSDSDNKQPRSINESVDELYKELNGVISTWKMGVNKYFILKHFGNLQKITTKNKTVVAKYGNEKFLYSNDALKTTWKSENANVFLEYKCDLNAPQKGVIESLQEFANNNYRISYISPILCQFEYFKPENVSTVECYPNNCFN